MSDTEIEWTHRPGTRGKSWNPVRGCSKVSPGCTNCYAERTAARGAHGPYKGLVTIGKGSPRWTGEVKLVTELLDLPLRTRAATTWFVNSMSDLFHEKLSDFEIGQVYDSMERATRHTFLVLTKRAGRMLEMVREWTKDNLTWQSPDGEIGCAPLPNVWLGVSVEDQSAAEERIPLLLETPAAVRFLSVEPLLGPVDLRAWLGHAPVSGPGSERPWLNQDRGIDWVIVGGESGPGARPCDLAWIRSVVEQCAAARVPCFVKQLGACRIETRGAGTSTASPTLNVIKSRKGKEPDEWPPDLRVREWPEVHS